MGMILIIFGEVGIGEEEIGEIRLEKVGFGEMKLGEMGSAAWEPSMKLDLAMCEPAMWDSAK